MTLLHLLELWAATGEGWGGSEAGLSFCWVLLVYHFLGLGLGLGLGLACEVQKDTERIFFSLRVYFVHRSLDRILALSLGAQPKLTILDHQIFTNTSRVTRRYTF